LRIIRFEYKKCPTLGALTNDQQIYPLPYSDFMELVQDAEKQNSTPLTLIQQLIQNTSQLKTSYEDLILLTPVVAPEVWAAGVTYFKSRQARNYETTDGKTDGSQTFYDKVYDAERPEIFLKSTQFRTVGPNEPVNIRSDSNWQIPEPEVGVVINKEGTILGYTIGNDMSSRDIEGENPLYLPQAKIWKSSCSIGPAIVLAESVKDPYDFDIKLNIYRDGKKVVEETANTSQLKRKYDELVSFLTRDNLIFDGTVLLTGTCAVPPNEFTLKDGDCIEIEVSEIGVLVNPVKQLVSELKVAVSK
jgi:2-dehydro-3-deoxy-D-arabinonate dehydratase